MCYGTSPASAGLSNIKQDSNCQVDTAKEDPKPTPTSCQDPVAWGACVPHMNIPPLLFLTNCFCSTSPFSTASLSRSCTRDHF